MNGMEQINIIAMKIKRTQTSFAKLIEARPELLRKPGASG